MPSFSPVLKALLIQTGLFLLLFVLITGTLGPWIVASKLLYGFYFFIYGNVGKMVIIGSILFFLFIRKKLSSIPVVRYPRYSVLFIVFSFLLIPVFFSWGEMLLLAGSPEKNIPLFWGSHLLLVSIPFFLLLGVFGLPKVVRILQLFRREIFSCLGVTAVLYVAIFQVWKLWPYVSSVVLAVVSRAFSLTFDTVRVIPPRTLIVEGFAVKIEQACSGLDSLFMFSALYTIIALIDWKEFDKRRLLLFAIPGAIGLFLVNIIRVYLIILIGVLWSPEVAIKLFHTYAGMILFILYFALFWKLSFSHLKRPKKFEDFP